ncbi:MAG TPA: hypothetical protein V6C86_10910 [Oculatellaceae cyanobacterium]
MFNLKKRNAVYSVRRPLCVATTLVALFLSYSLSANAQLNNGTKPNAPTSPTPITNFNSSVGNSPANLGLPTTSAPATQMNNNGLIGGKSANQPMQLSGPSTGVRSKVPY